MDILITILLGSFKFALTFPLAILEFHFSFFETILWINIGGIAGVLFFSLLSDKIIRWFNSRVMPGRFRNRQRPARKENRKIFTKRNKRIIKIRQKYGLWGIAATTPVLLSIPVGAFLMVRYYSRSRSGYLRLIGSNVVWSFIYTSFYCFCQDLLFSR